MLSFCAVDKPSRHASSNVNCKLRVRSFSKRVACSLEVCTADDDETCCRNNESVPRVDGFLRIDAEGFFWLETLGLEARSNESVTEAAGFFRIDGDEHFLLEIEGLAAALFSRGGAFALLPLELAGFPITC